MISVLLYGANGHMGKVVTEMIAQEEGIEIVAGVDAFGGQNADFPVFTSLADCTVPADVIIDFSTAKAVDLLLAYGVERREAVEDHGRRLEKPREVGRVRKGGRRDDREDLHAEGSLDHRIRE